MKPPIIGFKVLLSAAAAVTLLVLSTGRSQAQAVGEFGIELGLEASTDGTIPADIAYTGTGVFGETFTEVGPPADQSYKDGNLGTTFPYGGAQLPGVTLSNGVYLTTGTPDGLVPGEANQGGYAHNITGGLVFQSVDALESANVTNNTYNAVFQFSFYNLVPSTVYTIAAYGDTGAMDLSTDLTADAVLYGNAGSSAFTETSLAAPTTSNYVTFTGLTDSTGKLVVDYTADPTNPEYAGTAGQEQGGLSAISIEGPLNVVPEPSTWAMLIGGLGALAFVARRRLNALAV